MAASKALVSRLLVLALCCWVGDCRQSSAVSESPLLPTDDWHYPAEEASETQALLGSGLHVTELFARNPLLLIPVFFLQGQNYYKNHNPCLQLGNLDLEIIKRSFI